MKTAKIITLMLFLFVSSRTVAQNGLIGKWQTEDKVVIEFSTCGKFFCAIQTSAAQEKHKKDNGIAIAREVVQGKENTYIGTVIDPSNGKEYKATWTLSADAKILSLNVKWGFINYNEKWQRL